MTATDRKTQAGPQGPAKVADKALWQALGAEHAGAEFASAWLTLQCRAIAGVERGVLVLRDETGKLVPAARWPEGDGGSAALAKAAELALQHGKGVATPSGRDASRSDVLAFPLIIDGTVQAISALQCATAGEAALHDAMRQLQWGLASVEVVLRKKMLSTQGARFEATVAALEIASNALEADRFEDAARRFATELANRLGASRAAVGWHRRKRVRVVAISHALAFSRRMDAIRKLAGAMEEAVDEERSIAFPVPEGVTPLGTASHAALSESQGGSTVLTVPLLSGDHIVGAVLLEWQTPGGCSQHAVNLAEATADLLGPILDRYHRSERWLSAQAWDIVTRETARLVGPRHYGLKLATAAAVAVVAFFATYTTDYRISARATLEGQTRRTIAAGLDGYIASEHARPGQIVHAGEVMATLDSSELVLQRLRWIAQREKHRLELDKAIASGQRAQAQISRAQINEANAQIALLNEQIARTQIVAPFDGVVLSGDLSQSVGAAVQRTQTLFELAPLEAYRVVAHVPDSEIDRVHPKEKGVLALAAVPDESFRLEVETITPEAEVVDGVNTFRVEARLDGNLRRLRPNMEGVAKIDVGRYRLIWIWTHHMVAAVRLWLWSVWP